MLFRSLQGTAGYIPCTYDDSSGYHVQDQRYWNARLPRILVADSNGKITFGVAPDFTVPIDVICNDTHANSLICLATRMTDGFTLIDTTYLTVTAVGCGPCCPNLDCNVTGVVRGQHYDVTFDTILGTSTISPANNGEATTDLGADITADPGQNVFINFKLPTQLTGTAGTIPISFGASKGVRIEDGSLFNPNLADTFNSGTHAVISLRLGFSFTVPYDALIGDVYAGTVLCTASYIGLSIHKSASPDTEITTTSFVAAIAVTVSNDIIPRQYSLFQNYPNPFNSTTTIRYDLPERSPVSLKIYNMLGQEIATPINKTENAGTHIARWQADQFPSGVYFYRLDSESSSLSGKRFKQIKKMVLSK